MGEEVKDKYGYKEKEIKAISKEVDERNTQSTLYEKNPILVGRSHSVIYQNL